MSELACEHKVYLHYLIGGPWDGRIVPSSHRYDSYGLADKGPMYFREGDAEPTEKTDGWEALNCTDDYTEFAYFKVRMTEGKEP